MTLLERDPATLSVIEKWAAFDVGPEYDMDASIAAFKRTCAAGAWDDLMFAWYALWARPNQRLPEGEWDTLFIRAGRGYGKTRTGAEGVRKLVEKGLAGHVTIIAPTASDARDVLIEGPSGLLAVHPPNVRPVYKPSNRTVEWKNGAIGHVRSAEEPDGLRGLNSDLLWGDEPACLVGTTRVLTQRGWVPIRAIEVGEQVLTRRGWCRVNWTGPTRANAELVQVTTTVGVLVCTPDHLLATDDGWIAAGDVAPGSSLASWSYDSLSDRPPGSTGATPGSTAPEPATTPSDQATSCIGSSTRPPSAPSPTATTSTTSTATSPTTQPPTSHPSSTANTPSTTATPTRPPSSPSRTPPSPVSEPAATGPDVNLTSSCAPNAEPSSAPLASAPRSAPQPVGLGPSVLAVERLSRRAQTYDLSVQGRHEFIAEGIVVHNSWKSGREAWDNASLGNRLGRPHSILTGTPRPLPWLKEIEAMPGTVVRTGSTYENIGNLAPQFIALILGRYEGTRLGAQELHARYLEDVEGALWRLMVIEATRFAHWSRDNPWGAVVEQATLDARLALGLGAWSPEKGERRPWTTWVGVDPPGETAECGIVAGTAPLRGKAGRDHAVVLDDMSVAGAPEVWGARVVECFRKWNADGIVVEANQGGDMCRATIHAVDSSVPVEKIRAKESKADRAEPISALYSRGWVHHYGHLAALENQMTTWVPEESKSPDRLDAMVHLVTKLLSPTNLKQASVGNPLTVQRR